MFDFRHNHILQALFVLFLAWLVYVLQDVVLLLFVVFIVVVVLQPFVRLLRRGHMPAVFAVLLPIIVVAGVLVLIGFFVVPPLAKSTGQFIDKVPAYVHDLAKNSNLNIDASSLKNDITRQFGSIGQVVYGVTAGVAKVLVAIVTALVMTIYWLGSYDDIKKTLLAYVPRKSRLRLQDIWGRVEAKLGSWFRAQVLLSVAMGLLVWFGAWLVGLPFAGVLGVISGLLEVIPTLGPIASAVPGIAVGFAMSVETGVLAVVMYLLAHQIENHLLAPQIMGRTVRLHPLVIIISLLIGAELHGIVGVVLSVPVALCISAAVDSFRGEKIPDGNGGLLIWRPLVGLFGRWRR